MSSRSRAKRRTAATCAAPAAAPAPHAAVAAGVAPAPPLPAPAATRRESLALAAAWFALAFGLCCAAGALFGELAYHLSGVAIAGAQIALAVLAGLLLWRAMPSHPLVRRLDVALLILALLLAAACGLALWLEAVRSGLVRRSTLPAGLLRGLLVAPVWILTALAAAWCRSVIADGWTTARRGLAPERLFAIFWVAAAAALVTAWASRVSDLIVAPSAVFAAALLVTLFRLERFHNPPAADQVHSPSRWPRAAAGAALLATLLAAVLLAVAFRPARVPAAPLLSAPASASGDASAAARALVAARSPRCVTYTNPHTVTADAVWELDLDGPAYDVIILAPQSAPGELRRADARRLLRRLAAALVRGGRLVIEDPQPSQIEAAFWVARHDLAWPAACIAALTAPDAPQRYEALVLGPDLSPWFAQQAESQPAASDLRPASSAAASLRFDPARGPRHFDALRAAARR